MGRGIRCVFCGNVEIDRYTAVLVSSASCLLVFCFSCDCRILCSFVSEVAIGRMSTFEWWNDGLRIDRGR